LLRGDKKTLARAAAGTLVEYSKAAQAAFKEVNKILTKEIPRFTGTLIQELLSGGSFDRTLKTAKCDCIAAVKDALRMALNTTETAFDKITPDNFFQSLSKAINKYFPSVSSSSDSIQKINPTCIHQDNR
jgi:hypothetical protein